jgi:fumarylacetoacetase
MDALASFRCSPKTEQNPPPFAHLKWPRNGDGAIDITLRVTLTSKFTQT